MKKVIWALLTFALISVPARADKWAVGTYHTSQPLDLVFERTAKLIESKEWYIGTRWHIQSINRKQGTIHAATVSWGEYWGDIYVSMATQGTGTSIEAVMTLHSGAILHPASYAERFGKALKKLFPDLTFEIKRDVIPENFAFGVGQVSIPLVAATAPVVQPMQNPTVNQGTTVTLEPMPLVIVTAPAVKPMQSSVADQGTVPISPAQVNSIDNSLQQISASISQQTTSIASTPAPAVSQLQNHAPTVPEIFAPTVAQEPMPMVPLIATVVQPMQNYAPAQMQQMGEATQQLGNSLMMMGAEMDILAARNKQHVDEDTTRNAVTQFLSNANQMMNRSLATSDSEAAGQFEITAEAITKARDDVYVTLTNPNQRYMFNRVTNGYMLAFGKQMGDHVRQQASANREIDEEQYTVNLHRVLDSWYANDKDWRKIAPEMRNKLSERDKGRLKDGIDPETINTRTPHPEHSPQPEAGGQGLTSRK